MPNHGPWSLAMAEDETTFYLLVIVAVVAVLGLGLAVASVAWNESFGSMMGRGGSGMMGGPGSGTTTVTSPGPLEWTILVVSAAFFILAVVLVLRTRAARGRSDVIRSTARENPPERTLEPAPETAEPELVHDPTPASPSNAAAAAAPTAIAEPTLVKLLGEDERRMYLELRDHGGQMYQRDLVALGVFSKAKVTRVLDKLEAKGLIVREAHGMTNRVRLTHLPAR